MQMPYVNNINIFRDMNFMMEVLIRIVLLILFISLESVEPFIRKIHAEEFWLYKNPRTDSYFPVFYLWLTVTSIPLLTILLFSLFRKDKRDLIPALLAYTLIFGLNGVITNLLKIAVGRPRPDFLYRCFPDGNISNEMQCTGDPEVVIEGRKSFPSGHSSFSFACLGFTSLYLAAKLYVFHVNGRGQSWRLIVSITPLFFAAAIAISRTCDYHHHWEDVTVGMMIGLIVCYTCYRQYYPCLDHRQCHLPHSVLAFESNRLPSTNSLSNIDEPMYIKAI